METDRPHWREGVPEDVYHADRETVSSTGIRKILQSPATFKAHVIDGLAPEPTEDMEFGRLVHKVILEGADFLRTYVVMPEFTGYTLDGKESKQSKEAKQKRDAWIMDQQLAGNRVVTADDKRDVEGMLDSVINHRDAFALLKSGVSEISGYYTDPETGIACRIRPDFMSADRESVVDLKTTESCEEQRFSKKILNYRYDVQMAMYGEGAGIINEKPVRFHVFIAVEKKPPYETAVWVADQPMLDNGSHDYHVGLRALKQCRASGVYHGYQQQMREIGLPFWALRDRTGT